MTENNSLWDHPLVFFITRLSILLGMMLTFGLFASSLGLFLSHSIYGIDLLSDASNREDFSNPAVVNATKFTRVISSIGIFILPAWFFCKAINRDPADFLKINRRTAFPEILITIVAVFVLMPFISWLFYFNSKLDLPAHLEDLEMTIKAAEELAAKTTKAFLKADTISTLMANLFVVAVIPAIGEEFLFRGVLQNFIRMTSRNKHLSVWLAAIAFSAVHIQFYGFLPRVFLGAALGYIYLFTGNLWLSVLMHFVNNAFAVICSYTPIALKLPPALQEDYVFEAWYINAASAIAGIGLILLLRRITFKRVWYNGE